MKRTALKPGGPLKRAAIKRKKAKKKRRYRSRDREKWTNNDWKGECDTLWSRIIRARAMEESNDLDVPYCAVCRTLPQESRVNATKWEAHHLITRGQQFYRHIITNGICLCASHHQNSAYFSAEKTPHAFDRWLEEHHPDQHAWYAKNRYETHPGVKINYQQVHDILQEKLGKLACYDAGDDG